MSRMSETTPEEAESTNIIPNVIAEFYIWAEKSSVWQIEMYEWAEKLKVVLAEREIVMADKVPPPPPKWP